jgi:DNA-directed RNA polymerase subunit beta'
MLKKVTGLRSAGDTSLLPGQLVEQRAVLSRQTHVAGRRRRTERRTEPLILGITKASLATESFLSAASFQGTNEKVRTGRQNPAIRQDPTGCSGSRRT